VIRILGATWYRDCPINGENEWELEAVEAYWCPVDECWLWSTFNGYEEFHNPTHWLACVKVDPFSLGRK
jgi:hypothetical protein